VIQTTALVEAAEYGRLEVVRLLLAAGAAPDQPTTCGGEGRTTPLMQAAGNGPCYTRAARPFCLAPFSFIWRITIGPGNETAE
jgi:hypothetical protein